MDLIPQNILDVFKKRISNHIDSYLNDGGSYDALISSIQREINRIKTVNGGSLPESILPLIAPYVSRLNLENKQHLRHIIAEAIEEDSNAEKTLEEILQAILSKVGDYTKEEQLNESVIMAAAGVALSAPVIAKTIGQLSGLIGKKTGSDKLQNIGNWISKKGEAVHSKYIGIISKVLKPAMPKASDEQIKKVAGYIFLATIAALGATALSGAYAAMAKGQAAYASVEGALGIIKNAEVIKGIAKQIPSLAIKLAK